MFLSKTNRLRAHLPNFSRRFSVEADSAVPRPNDAWISKVVSTIFVLSCSSTAAARLAPFREALTPFVAFQAIRRLQDPGASLAFFELLREDFCVKHSDTVYQFLIETLCQADRGVAAHKVLDKMLTDGYPMDGILVEALVDCYANKGELEAAMGLLDSACENNCSVRAAVYNKVLDQLFKRSRSRDGIQFFNRLLSSPAFAPDTCSFNIIIKSLCQVGDIDKAFEFFNDMVRFQCSPDTITHNILIQGYCKTNQLDKGHEILRNIPCNGVFSPNIVSYTSLISGYCKKGEMNAALSIFTDMVNSGIKPNNFTYNSLIDGYGKAGDMASAISLYEKMIDDGCSPDVVTFTSVIDGHCRSGRVDDAVNIWNKMTESCVWPNHYTFSIVINALCKQNRLDDAYTFVRELLERKDIAIRSFMLNPVIHGFCKVGNLDVANWIVSMMEGRRCFPDEVTYTILIIGHCMSGRISDAVFLFHKMIATGCSPDNLAINSMVSCLLKAGMPREANRILSSIRKGSLLVHSPGKNVHSSLTKSSSVSAAA